MKHIILVIATVAALILTGCSTTEKLAEGIATKNINGNGTFFKSSVGINAETKTPEISSIIVNGDYSSAKSGTNSILYRSERTGSIWNASVTTEKKFVSITLENGSNVGDVIRAVSDVLRAAAEANKEDSAAETAEP